MRTNKRPHKPFKRATATVARMLEHSYDFQALRWRAETGGIINSIIHMTPVVVVVVRAFGVRAFSEFDFIVVKSRECAWFRRMNETTFMFTMLTSQPSAERWFVVASCECDHHHMPRSLEYVYALMHELLCVGHVCSEVAQ